MRLALINQFYAPDLSPTAQLCASLAEHRVKRGDTVTVVCGRGSYAGIGSQQVANGPVRVRRVWATQFGKGTKLGRLADWMTFYLFACLRCLMLPRQDAIVALTTPPYIVLAAALHKLIHPRTKLVLWNMDCYPEVTEGAGLMDKAGLVSRILRWCNRAVFQTVNHLVCLDQAMAELLLSQYCAGRRETPCTVIPNWEPAVFFPEGESAASWSRSEVDSQGRFVVLYLGNAGYAHEFETLLDAAELLRNTSVTFLFVGGGASRKWIEQEFHRRRLSNVVFRDYVPTKEETRSIMASADCSLITLKSWAAGVVSPSKLHANLAMRLPIVYIGPLHSNVDACIDRFQCGISCRPGDANRVADFILQLVKDAPARQEYGRRARAAFEDAYCDLQTLPQWDQVLDRLYGLATSHFDRSPSRTSESSKRLASSPKGSPADAPN